MIQFALNDAFILQIPNFRVVCSCPIKNQDYKETDFASSGGKRVTRYANHCPCCSLDLRKIMNAAKADETDSSASGSASNGGTGGTGEARFGKKTSICFLLCEFEFEMFEFDHV